MIYCKKQSGKSEKKKGEGRWSTAENQPFCTPSHHGTALVPWGCIAGNSTLLKLKTWLWSQQREISRAEPHVFRTQTLWSSVQWLLPWESSTEYLLRVMIPSCINTPDDDSVHRDFKPERLPVPGNTAHKWKGPGENWQAGVWPPLRGRVSAPTDGRRGATQVYSCLILWFFQRSRKEPVAVDNEFNFFKKNPEAEQTKPIWRPSPCNLLL